MSDIPALENAVLAAMPLGLLVGLGFSMFRVSGVDFRQWVQKAGELREVSDTSWIGRARVITLAFAGFAALLALVAVVACPPACLLDGGCPAGLAAGLRWPQLGAWVGLAAGLVLGQFGADLTWRAGLRLLPTPALPIAIEPRLSSATPPASTARRRLVLFCDGTWNWPDGKHDTNVVRLLRAVVPVTAGGVDQIAYYHPGVGTGNLVDRLVGGGAGIGIANSVKACYGFLADNYRQGDEIILFGFSRGAFVARSVSGLVNKIGILSKIGMARFNEVWDWYTDVHKRQGLLDEISADRIAIVPIRCIGVWDTVGALGIPGSRLCAQTFAFHETALGAQVQYAFQALAMSEKRGNFQAAVMVPHANPVGGQHLEQMWFPGAHSNIGGGYPEHRLSDATLVWMASRLRRHGILELDPTSIAASAYRDHPPVGKVQNSRAGFWSLAFCPVPRPVGLVSATEGVHGSAWMRAEDAQTHRSDPYRTAARRTWLGAMAALRANQDADESAADLQPTGEWTPEKKYQFRKLGVCDRLMLWFGGSG